MRCVRGVWGVRACVRACMPACGPAGLRLVKRAQGAGTWTGRRAGGQAGGLVGGHMHRRTHACVYARAHLCARTLVCLGITRGDHLALILDKVHARPRTNVRTHLCTHARTYHSCTHTYACVTSYMPYHTRHFTNCAALRGVARAQRRMDRLSTCTNAWRGYMGI